MIAALRVLHFHGEHRNVLAIGVDLLAVGGELEFGGRASRVAALCKYLLSSACQQTVARVNLIRILAADNKEGDPITYLRRPLGPLIESELDGRPRGIIPDQSIAAAR